MLCILFLFPTLQLQKQTTDNLPFQSPLLGRLLGGYFIKGKPKQDQLLIAHLHRIQRIPVPLIAMATVLVSLYLIIFSSLFAYVIQIGHALQEYSSGYKVDHALSAPNVAGQ